MRRIGDAAWRYFDSYTDAGKAFSVSSQDVSHLIIDPTKATEYVREGFEARPACAPEKRERPTKGKAGGAPQKKPKYVEGATQKATGKWHASHMFPGREFDDLDEYRAAKKQRAEFRAAYYADNNPKYNPPRNTH